MSVLRFEYISVRPIGLMPGTDRVGGGWTLGGIFRMEADFERDQAGRYRSFEFEQSIKGAVRVAGTFEPAISVPGMAPGSVRSIHPNEWREDGVVHQGRTLFYGRRANPALPNDAYYSGQVVWNGGYRSGQVDMLNGDKYRGFDRYGVYIPMSGSLYSPYRGQVVSVTLRSEVELSIEVPALATGC